MVLFVCKMHLQHMCTFASENLTVKELKYIYMTHLSFISFCDLVHVYTSTADLGLHWHHQYQNFVIFFFMYSCSPLLDDVDIYIPLHWYFITYSIIIWLIPNLVQSFIYLSSVIFLSYTPKSWCQYCIALYKYVVDM